MNLGTIPIRLRWRVPALFAVGLLAAAVSRPGGMARGDDASPPYSTIRASRPLSKVSRPRPANQPTVQPAGNESRYPQLLLPPGPGGTSSEIPTETPLRVAQEQDTADAEEFAYPLQPEPGEGRVLSNGGAPGDPAVADPLFDSLADGEPEPGFLEPARYYPDHWGDEHIAWEEDCDDGCFGRCSPWYRLFHLGIREPTYDAGIGQERVMFAPFEVDVSQPLNHYRLRFDMVYGVPFPDRAEYFFANPRQGRKFVERSVDYQDLRFQVETGGKFFSIFTDYPVRILDPEINGNTAGFGDMVVGNKAVLINGRYWQLTQVLRTQFNTGNPRRGLSTGRTSLEPGLILRYKWTPRTYLHGELKYLVPTGGDRMHSGDVLSYGFSLATVLYETDTFAVLPTWEITGHSVLDGLQTIPLTVAPDGSIPDLDPTKEVLGRFPHVGQTVDVDGATFGTVQTGVRFVVGPKGDLGLLEVGVSGGISMANNAFFDHRALVEFRWSY